MVPYNVIDKYYTSLMLVKTNEEDKTFFSQNCVQNDVLKIFFVNFTTESFFVYLT